MDIGTLTHLISAISNVVIAAAFVVGYYVMIKLYREMITEMREQHLAGGRPQVIVDNDFARLPEVDVVVRNISTGAAKDISFEFSAPVESSDGTVISDLPYFKHGLDFLAPEGSITAYWDHLDTLVPFLEKKGLENGISVTTSYKDLAGHTYETMWNLNPLIYKNRRFVHHRDIEDLVNAVEKLTPTSGGNLTSQGPPPNGS